MAFEYSIIKYYTENGENSKYFRKEGRILCLRILTN